MNKNAEIKALIKKSRFFNYEIADAVGINEVSFSRWFRRELTEDQRQKIIEAICKLQKGEE